MTIPSDPAAMQAYVLEQLLKGSSSKPQSDSKAPAKFAKQMVEHIETKLRDNLHHEIETDSLQLTPTRLLKPALERGAAVSVLWDSTGAPLGFFRCDNVTYAVLARLCFGGDVEAPIHGSTNPPTPSEIGMQDILAKMIASALEKTGLASVSKTLTLLEEAFESDEFADCDAYKCGFELTIGETKCRINLTLPKTLVMGTTDAVEADGIANVKGTNDELMQTPVQASVKLKPQPTTLGRIRSLKVGDCLPLVGDDQLKGQFMVSDQEIFDCQIGRSGDAYSLKIGNRTELAPPDNTATSSFV
ncbi:MAG: FliM/FliN family flagellar motor switch protein [Rhizobiaceae bacterium]